MRRLGVGKLGLVLLCGACSAKIEPCRSDLKVGNRYRIVVEERVSPGGGDRPCPEGFQIGPGSVLNVTVREMVMDPSDACQAGYVDVEDFDDWTWTATSEGWRGNHYLRGYFDGRSGECTGRVAITVAANAIDLYRGWIPFSETSEECPSSCADSFKVRVELVP